MTDDERAQYAAEQRAACAPLECSHDPRCWVELGGRDTLDPQSITKAIRCAACGGKLRWEAWREPRDLALSAQAELMARTHGRKRQHDVSKGA